MGDSTSDWQGVGHTFSKSESDTIVSAAAGNNSISSQIFSKIAYTNSVKTSYACNTILNQKYVDGDFEGQMEFTRSSTEPTGAMIYIEKAVPNDEQTETDGSYTRFETGRALKGVYYSAQGAAVNFTVTLESAYSLAAYAGITIASCITLLNF